MATKALLFLALCGGCVVDYSSNEVLKPEIPRDVFLPLNTPADAHDELCDHDPEDLTFPDEADRITNRFCQDVKGGTVPEPKGLNDLLKILDLDFKNLNGGNGVDGNPAFAILGHSSALTARKISQITPTVFVFTPLNPDGTLPIDYTFLGFDPGEPFVEIASFHPADKVVNFYLVLFDKECTKLPAGCQPNDMLNQNVTTGWSNVRIYESTTALNNTIADCRQCHIGTGKDDPETGDALILRMQEIEPPFTHWFGNSEGGRALYADFFAAHGTTEDYGPIPAALLSRSDPAKMAAFIKAAGFGTQPNVFQSKQIEDEVTKSAVAQPILNTPRGRSATWDRIYDASLTGQFIPVPYHDVKISDPDKLKAATEEYRNYRIGVAPLSVDIREVFLDEGLAEMGFAPRPKMSGRDLLVQQCQQCHHSNLDPTISRDNFLVDKLNQMSRAEKDLAIERIRLPLDTVLTMPPPLFRTLSQADRDAMIAELQK